MWMNCIVTGMLWRILGYKLPAMQRRKFLRNLGVSATAIAIAPRLTGAPIQQKTLGAQLWTIRDALNKDLEGSLHKLAALGYSSIEIFGYNGTFWGKTAKEFSNICKNAGLNIISSHYDTGRHDKANGTLLYGWQKAVDDAAAMHVQYMVCAWLYPEERVSLDLYKSLAGMLNTAGETCRKANIQFGYHSHDFEFPPIDGIVPYRYLLDNTDPALVKMEADLYWMVKAGQDPVAWFKQYPGRFPLWHVKDMEKGTGNFTEVGNGTIDFDRLFAARATAGLKHWFVEQDECKGDPFNSLAMSRDFLAKKNF